MTIRTKSITPRLLAAAAALLFLSAAGPAAPGGDLASLLEAERAFARASLDKGMKESFLRFLAEESVLFRPGPVDGRKWIADHPATPGTLSWEPTFAEISRAGDLGYTSGPWEYKEARPDAPPPAYGHFMSIWRREAKGTWRVALDLGNSHPKAEGPAEPLTFREPGPGAATGGDPAAVLAAEEAFSRASAAQGIGAAFAAHAASDVRLLRDGARPAVGVAQATALLGEGKEKLAWEPAAAEMAASGDLGYAFGEYRAAGQPAGAGKPAGYYARVWRREAGDNWRIAVDATIAAPPEPKK